MASKRLLIVGPPGAGKGTQSAVISEVLGIPAIATGDIFRWNIANDTELGQQVKSILDAGDFVPDELTCEVVADRLLQEDARDGFLLDGFPRTVGQVEFLDGFLADHGLALDGVIQLEADIDEVVKRLRQRAIEQGRSDDTEEAIHHRQIVFAEQTEPILAIFRERGILLPVNGLGSVEDVTSRIMTALENLSDDEVTEQL
ncbi:MAG: adenylate kinase [Microbacteriaceae bacterium]|nr:adenylate kinase [Microbacteriaceae bacterium]